MDDERGPDRRSSPDLPSAARKRKASRGLRVPNDPVPRASQPDLARVSIADDREIDEFGDRVTQVERASAEAAALIHDAQVAHAPVPIVPIDASAVQANEHAATVIDDQPRAAVEPPAPAPAVDGPKRRPSGANRLIAVSDEGASTVRQVRRKIRSIGSDEPMPASAVAPDDGPDLSELDEAVVDEVDEVSPIIASLSSAPAGDAANAAPPALTVAAPIVEARRVSDAPPRSSDAPRPSRLPVPSAPIASISVEPPTDDEVEVDSAEVEDEAPPAPVATVQTRSIAPPPPPPPASAAATEPVDSVEVVESVEASSQPAAEHDDDAPQVEADSDPVSELVADSGADSEVEVEEPTEEINIPDEIAARPSVAPTPPPRSTAPDGTRPPPPPRATPAEQARATERPTMVSSDAKPRRRHWWEEIFNDDYLRTQRRYSPDQVTAEGNFIEASLGVEKGASVLDVGCGIGRQAVELATRGYEVLGLDLSLAMLSRASDNAQQRGAKLNFLQSDMLEMEFTELFDAAYCVGSTFGFFDDDKNADVIQRLHRALKPGGTLLLEVVNRDCAAEQHPAMTWYEADGCVCMEETNFNWFTSRLEGKRTLLLEDGRQREQKFSMRMYSLHELGKVLHSAGFRVIEVSGNQKTPGAFFGTHSMMLIILAQKRTDDE